MTLLTGDNGRQYQGSVPQAHYVLGVEPGRFYLTDFERENCKGVVANEIFSHALHLFFMSESSPSLFSPLEEAFQAFQELQPTLRTRGRRADKCLLENIGLEREAISPTTGDCQTAQENSEQLAHQ